MKRILFVVPFLSSGGAERVVSIWTSEMAKLGGDLHLLVFYRLENEYPLDDKVVVHTIVEEELEYKSMPKMKKLSALRKAFKEIKPDVVLPFVSYVGIMTLFAKIGLPLKIIETIRINPQYSFKTRSLRWLWNISVFLSERCIVQTKMQLSYFPQFMQKHMAVFANPIANEFTEKRKEFTNNSLRNIIAVGRLEKQKNYPMLISAFSQIAERNKNLTLSIYGEGSLRTELNNYISTLNLQGRVVLCGRTNNMPEVLRNADLFILASDAEGMPNSLMEAMAVGLPCISTDCPTGPSDLIEHTVNGILIPVGDREALIRAIDRLVDDIDVSIEMGRKARETILHKYAAQISAKEIMQFIDAM